MREERGQGASALGLRQGESGMTVHRENAVCLS